MRKLFAKDNVHLFSFDKIDRKVKICVVIDLKSSISIPG